MKIFVGLEKNGTVENTLVEIAKATGVTITNNPEDADRIFCDSPSKALSLLKESEAIIDILTVEGYHNKSWSIGAKSLADNFPERVMVYNMIFSELNHEDAFNSLLDQWIDQTTEKGVAK